MTKRHLKSYTAPKSWGLKRKEHKFVVKPSPGKHKIEFSIPLASVIKRMGLAETKKEVKNLLHKREIMVDQKEVHDEKLPVGLMDVVSVKKLGKNFRVLLDSEGKIFIKEIKKESSWIKPCKIISKTILPKGRLQLNLFDGRNIITKEDGFKAGDSILITLPDQKIAEGLKLDRGAFIMLIGGKHAGDFGNAERLEGEKIVYVNSSGNLVETLKKFAFVVKEEFAR